MLFYQCLSSIAGSLNWLLWSYHTKNPDLGKWAGFTTKNPASQVHNFGSNSVFEFCSYHDMFSTYIVQCKPLFHLPLPDLRSDEYTLSHYRNPTKFAENMLFFHSNSMNIGAIANLKAGGGRARKTAQSTYSSCHDKLGSQIINCSKSCRNLKMEQRCRYNPANKPWVYVWSWSQPRQDKAGPVFGCVRN